ncbi:MAG: hypothetical protein KDB14_11525 [Planctomycetales bacterium]|nr:hypothetical protein [Planctomycetales bacterium]
MKILPTYTSKCLFAGVTLACCALAYWTYCGHIQRRSIAEIKAVDGYVTSYRYRGFGKMCEKVLGLHLVAAPIELAVHSERLVDVDSFGSLPEVVSLNLQRCHNVVDISPLRQLRKIRRLDISGTRVCDLAPLANKTSLRHLYLASSNVTNLCDLKNLRLTTLDISGTDIERISALEGMQSLEEINLSNTHVSDIRPLHRLTHLKRIDASGSNVTDLSPLKALVNLQELILNDTPLNTLHHLPNLQKLAVVWIEGTKVPSSEIVEFSRVHPQCVIKHNFGTAP